MRYFTPMKNSENVGQSSKIDSVVRPLKGHWRKLPVSMLGIYTGQREPIPQLIRHRGSVQ